MKTINSKHVVFVTGAFVTHFGWDEWQKYFQSKGFCKTARALVDHGGQRGQHHTGALEPAQFQGV